MNFYIDKPTLRDISAMRNLVLSEVQKGIILDRSEDEMAGAIRSYSVIRVVLNSSLGTPCGDLADFGHCADFSLALRPKSAKNSTTSAANTRIYDLDSANPTKNAESSLDSANPALSTHEANSTIADEFLGFCEASDKDKTKVYRGSETKRALRKQFAHTCKSLKRRCESEFASPIVAFAALQILSLTLGEVRSLIVDENYRRNGLATMLIEHLLKEARALNLKEVLALTYQREVFEKLGFKEIAKESLPNQKIWADCIKCKKFPVCDEIALTKIL